LIAGFPAAGRAGAASISSWEEIGMLLYLGSL